MALVACMLASLAWADEGGQPSLPVKLKADSLRYIETDERVEARGNVYFEFEDITVFADEVQLDLARNAVQGRGNVRIVRGSTPLYCQFFSFDLEDGKLNVDRFTAELESEIFMGVANFSAQSLQSSANVYEGREGCFSTCEYLKPHYYLSAGTFYYYLNDHIEASSVWLVENDLPLGLALPLFYMPYYVYYMGSRQVVYLFPEIGNNKTYGSYAKNSFDYYYDTGFWGLLRLDWFEKKGWGIGVDHHYQIDGGHEGRVQVYNQDETDTGAYNRDYVLEHRFAPQENWDSNLNAKWTKKLFSNGRREDQLQYSLGAGGKDREGNARLNYSFNKNFLSAFDQSNVSVRRTAAGTESGIEYQLDVPNLTGLDRQSLRLNGSMPLTWNVRQQLNVQYEKNRVLVGVPYDQRLDYTYLFQHQSPFYSSLQVEYKRYVDVDADQVTSDDALNFVEHLPKATLHLNEKDLGLFKVNAEMEAGLIRENRFISSVGRNRDFTTTRYRLAPSLSKDWTLPLGTQLGWNVQYDQLAYGPGDQLFKLTEKVNMSQTWFGVFRNQADWMRSFSEGNSPFYMDTRGGEAHRLNEKASLYYDNPDRWALSLVTGFNWLSQKWDDIIYESLIQPHGDLRYTNRVKYSIENKQFVDWVAQLHLHWLQYNSWDFSYTRNLQTGELQRGQSEIGIRLTGFDDHWEQDGEAVTLKLQHEYDSRSQTFMLRTWELEKGLHCRKLRFSWNELRKEWKFFYEINAFPDQPFGLSNSETQGLKLEGFLGQAVKLE